MLKIKEFFKSNIRIAMSVFFILEFFINIWITPNQYDSEFFIKQMQEMSIFEFISMRYETWTSRVIIETIICLILPNRAIIWGILNTVMMTILTYSILKLFVKNDEKRLTWMSIYLILIYPLNKIATCDWGAGSINYTWPLAMLLFSFIPIKKILTQEKVKKYMYPFYSIALIFACNQEQICAIACGMYAIIVIYLMIKNKNKIHPFVVIQSVLVILSLLVIVTCPGNYARKNEEIETYYMQFKSFGFFDKVSLGITSTISQLLTNMNLVFFTFSLISVIYIFMKYKNNLYRTTALIPFVSSLILGPLKDIVCRVYPYFGIFYETLTTDKIVLAPGNYLDFINFIPLVLSLVILGSIALNILLIFKDLKSNIAIVIYLLGLMSRVALGFSPTVFSSTDRTFIFFEFAFIIISILIWQEFLKETDKTHLKVQTRVTTFIVVLAVLQYVHILIYTLMSQI